VFVVFMCESVAIATPVAAAATEGAGHVRRLRRHTATRVAAAARREVVETGPVEIVAVHERFRADARTNADAVQVGGVCGDKLFVIPHSGLFDIAQFNMHGIGAGYDNAVRVMTVVVVVVCIDYRCMLTSQVGQFLHRFCCFFIIYMSQSLGFWVCYRS
jgi:hypothetical protein